MAEAQSSEPCLLVLDTCGERASLALFRGDHLLCERVLAERTASAALLSALRDTLASQDVRLRDLEAIGVVSGPGSFTGVRVGLSLAKGLCEALGRPLAAVSRLAVLVEVAGLQQGFALLRAGRDEVYVREVGPGGKAGESMMRFADLEPLLQWTEVAVASLELQEKMQGVARSVHQIELSANDAVGLVRRCLAAGGSALAEVDANYVRNEEAIYRRGALGPQATETESASHVR